MIPSNSNRTIPIRGATDSMYATLRGSAQKDCWRCKGSGIHSYKQHGNAALVCPCAWETFSASLQFLDEEKRRRAEGLPPRKATLVDGKFEIGILPGGYGVEDVP